jgi:hypothetical protein
MAVASIPFAFVTPNTNELLLGTTLFFRGLGLGFSMMPRTAAAYFDLSNADIPRASTTMNIIRQVGGSVATALFAVVLQRQLVDNLGHNSKGSILSSTAKLPAAAAHKVAGAFAHTFWWAVFTILIAFVPTLFLPNKGGGQKPTEGDAVDEPAVAPALAD